MLDRQAERQAEKIADLEAYIRKYGAGQRAKQAKDREKKLARIERGRDDARRSSGRPWDSTRSSARATSSSRPAICPRRTTSRLFQISTSRPARAVRRGDGPERLGQVDADQDPDRPRKARRAARSSSGTRSRSATTTRGSNRSHPETTVVRAVWPEDDPDWVQGDVRDLLARFGLSGDIVFQTVGQLSGGEKAKAALARLCATGANLLVMDEPTNHLDIWSCEALERSIREFEGTVLVVTHDRYFLNQVADRLIVVADGRARVIEGDYETYQRLTQQEAERRKARPPRPPRPPTRGSADGKAIRRRRSGSGSSPIARRPTWSARSPRTRPRSPSSKTSRPARHLARSGQGPRLQLRHEDLKSQLARLYEHWEEAVEFNS